MSWNSSHTNDGFHSVREYNFKIAEMIRQPYMKKTTTSSMSLVLGHPIPGLLLCLPPLKAPACFRTESSWVITLCSTFSEEGLTLLLSSKAMKWCSSALFRGWCFLLGFLWSLHGQCPSHFNTHINASYYHHNNFKTHICH